VSELVLRFDPGVFDRKDNVSKWGKTWNLSFTRVDDKALLLFSHLSDKELHPYELHIDPQIYRDKREKVWFTCARHWGKGFVSRDFERIYNGYILYIPYQDLFEFLLMN